MKLEMWTAQAVAEIEGLGVDSAPEAPAFGATAEPVVEIAPLIQRIADSSVGEIEELMAHLQATRDSLQFEGERIQREAANYLDFAQMASASIKIISDTVQEWGKAGYAVRGRPKPGMLEATPAEVANDAADILNDVTETSVTEPLVQDAETTPGRKAKAWA